MGNFGNYWDVHTETNYTILAQEAQIYLNTREAHKKNEYF